MARHIEKLKEIFGCFGKPCGSTTNGQVLNELESLTRQKKGALFEKCAIAEIQMGMGSNTISPDTVSLTEDTFEDFFKIFDYDNYDQNFNEGETGRFYIRVDIPQWEVSVTQGYWQSFSVDKTAITITTPFKWNKTTTVKVYVYWSIVNVKELSGE